MMRRERCEFCDGLIARKITRIRFNYKRKIIYVDNVPVRMCGKCGEIYYEAHVYKRLEKIAGARRKIRPAITFPLADYRAA